MTWTRRTDTRKGGMADGITFEMWETKGRGEVAHKDKKLHLDGRTSLTLALNQRKYGDELIAQVYSQGPGRVQGRRANGYNRVQVYLPANLDTADALEQIAARIRRLALDARETIAPEKEST